MSETPTAQAFTDHSLRLAQIANPQSEIVHFPAHGKPIDPNRYFVLCANVIGGCMGSTGPSSINPATGRPYGLDFPVITVRDMVRAQARLLDHLGIAEVLCVLGGSMGGMLVLEWAATYKDRVFSAV